MTEPTAPPISDGEPVFTALRVSQAANRLEVMRGIERAPDKLLSRLLRKYPAINIRFGNQNFRFFDLGPAI